MRQPRFWVEIAIVVVVAVIAFFVGRMSATLPGTGNTVIDGRDSMNPEPRSTTREDVPANTVVPGPNENVPANVATPDLVIAAAPGVESKKRIFKITIDGNKFTPDTVIMNAGDIANVTFTAVDRAYQIVQPDYGFSLSIAKGESKLLEGHFGTSGKYLFYCSSCGGPDAGPRGYFTVVP